MTQQALGASAPIHPSYLTSRESSIVSKALAIIEAKRLKRGDVLWCFEDFQHYLILRFAGLVHEQGHVIYLDVNRCLIEADTLAYGNQSQVTWDFRHIAYRSMALGAEYVVMAHNHPSDNPIPSGVDVQNMIGFERSLRLVGINLLDSFVVTTSRITSIREYNKCVEEAANRDRIAVDERRRAERRAKISATKTAKRSDQLHGATA